KRFISSYGMSLVHKSMRMEFLYCESHNAKKRAFAGNESVFSPSVDDQFIVSGTLFSSNPTSSVISAFFIFYLNHFYQYQQYTIHQNKFNLHYPQPFDVPKYKPKSQIQRR